MTEEEWLTGTDAISMLRHLGSVVGIKHHPSRRLTLFNTSCCRDLWVHLSITIKGVVEVLERWADGEATNQEFRVSAYVSNQASWQDVRLIQGLIYTNGYLYGTDEIAAACTVVESCRELRGNSAHRRLARQPLFLRDIFGNPFRPVTFAAEWRTEAAVGIASQMYDSRDFGNMPVLADALQDAGCELPEILNHCREPGTHVRGCWVVDLVLGKA